MKKVRIIAIALALTMVIAMLAGCVKQEDVDAVQAKLDAANAELTKVKGDLESTKADLATTEGELKTAEDTLNNSKVFPQDPFTSASVPLDKYDLGATPQSFIDAGYTGTYLISTVNPDGTANVGYLIFGLKVYEGGYYLVMNEKKQSGINLARNGEGVLVWAANYDAEGSIEGKNWSTLGLKMTINIVAETDPAYKALMPENPSSPTHVYKVVSYVALG